MLHRSLEYWLSLQLAVSSETTPQQHVQTTQHAHDRAHRMHIRVGSSHYSQALMQRISPPSSSASVECQGSTQSRSWSSTHCVRGTRHLSPRASLAHKRRLCL